MINEKNSIEKYLKRLFYITRSITGNGNRETLEILKEIIPLSIKEYRSGDIVYDWQIPKEWNIKDAWIKNGKGEKIIDFKNSNLHVVSYSIPVNKNCSYEELKEHLHFRKDLPDAIPYRTNYYSDDWGFCLSYDDFQKMDPDDKYEVMIDSKKDEGSLTIGELLIEGKTKKEYLISCYICHPSMANDSLSGVIATAFIAKELYEVKSNLEHSYRIIFVPETIGAIAYCAKNEAEIKKIKNGIVITTCGGPGKSGYKQSWDRSNVINDIVEEVFRDNKTGFITYPFDIHGSDERQYSSQAFRINCVTITKDKYYEYKYYHTSKDDLNFVSSEYIYESVKLYLHLIGKLDKNIVLKNLKPNCEVMLKKYDLYSAFGGSLLPNIDLTELDIVLWLLFYCDGRTDLYSISKKIDIGLDLLYRYTQILIQKNLLQYADE